MWEKHAADAADTHRAMCGKPSLQAMCSGVQPSSSLCCVSAPYWTSSFTHSRFPDSTASWMAAMPAVWEAGSLFNHHSTRQGCVLSGFCFSRGLTWVVDGVQGHSLGSDETSNPLQLPVLYVVSENDVVGEVHAADWLHRSWALAADWDATVLGVSLDPHGLGHGARVVLHPGQSQALCSCWETVKLTQLCSCRSLIQSDLVLLSLCGTSLPVRLLILSVRLF